MLAARRQGGFTLLEVLIVMLIMAMVAGIALPRFQAFLGSRLKSDMRALIGTVELAFFLATSQKKPVRINFDISRGQYWLSMLQITDPEQNIGEFVDLHTDKRELSSGVRFVDVFVAHAGKVDRGEAFATCLPQGFCEPTVIHLNDDYGHEYTMRIKPLTGEVAIYQGYRDFASLQPNQTVW